MTAAPFLLGLTGSIGMGKSTTAGLFAAEGVPVWDADATVHALYAPHGAAVRAVSERFPGAVVDGAVDRAALRQIVAADPSAMAELEARVHPLVAAHRAGFIDGATKCGARLIVLDIPLLFETGAETGLNAVLVVSAPAEVQSDRVLARPGMTPAYFQDILGRQMPDAEKRRRATWVIDTTELGPARAAVRDLVHRILAGNHA